MGIGSGKYPRFNFKVNDNVYFGIGDGGKKEYMSNIVYTEPTDYNSVKCYEAKEENKCLDNNTNSKILSNMDLCTYNKETNKCEENKIFSKYRLVYKETPQALLCEGKELNSIENIYDYIGQPLPNGVHYK